MATKYMMATKAFHKMGDITRSGPDLCVVYDEDSENYIGNWVTGFGFFNVKFPKSTTRELTDEEKEKWHDVPIVVGGRHVGTIYTKEVKYPDTKESPVIVFPNDEMRKNQLCNKLVEYKTRLDPYRSPELQMSIICKITVLERLIIQGKIVTWDLYLEMAEVYGFCFNVHDFENACNVIKDYCTTGGQNVHGGTGLPVSQEVK